MGNLDDDWISDDEPIVAHLPDVDQRPQGSKAKDMSSDARKIIEIGRNDVGKLIGRSGASIKDLRSRSGCRIEIGDESRSGRKAIEVEIRGRSDTEVDKAVGMIEEHLGYNNSFYGGKDDEEVIDWGTVNEQHEQAQKERWAKCPPLIKEFYKEHPETANMTNTEAEKFREENNNIVVSNFNPEAGSKVMLKPVAKFHHAFHNFPDVMATITKQEFERPSPIQAQAWPYLLSGEDLIGIAQTGTGKTLAFLLPAFIHIDEQPVPRSVRGGPNVLVLCPTRELALQIAGEVDKYEYRGIKSVCVYGGGDRKKQMKVITDGVQIIIATPGRLNDLVEAKCIKVESITYLVLDEADRMLDMGFEPQIRKVMLDIRPDRQTVMTSATWPAGVRRLASNYMNDPVTVFIGSLDLAAVHSVSQQIIMIENGEDEKREILMDFFSKMDKGDKVMVFVGKKTRADDISSDLSLKGIDCQCIHGDREQSDREQALLDLKTGEVRILIATDVASRGIDITDITHVINFDFPRNIEEYVHRVGRTGRAGRTGVSITMMERRDRKQAEELIKILQEAGQEVPDELEELAEKYRKWKIRDDEERKLYGRSKGPGGGDGCFKCGEFGHMSRDCPQGRGGCFNCGEQGHEKRNCPKRSSSGKGRGSRW